MTSPRPLPSLASLLAGHGEIAEGEVAANLALALRGEQAWNSRCKASSGDDEGKLGEFLTHVLQTVPFYQSRFAGQSTGWSPRLQDFPLTSRRDLEVDLDRFVSSSHAEDASAYVVKTSGSLGQRLPISYELASSYGTNYATYAAVTSVMPDLRQHLQPARLGVVLLGDSVPCQAITLFLPALNYALLQRFCLHRDNDALARQIGDLRQQTIPLLYGKPHGLLELADLDRKLGTGGGRISAHALLVSGENLYEDQRARIEAWFGGPVINAYLSAEGGLIGLECRHRTGLHVQRDRVVLEVLSAEQDPCGEGTGELVLTNFANWAMAFVRYRTGDRGTLRNIRCTCGFCGPTLVDFPGRDATAFRIAFGHVETRRLQEVFALLPVEQFQIVQRTPDTFRVKWVPEFNVTAIGEVEYDICRGLRAQLGDVSVSVEAASRIAPSRGGKVCRYVSDL